MKTTNRILLNGLSNTRDLGGYTTLEGRNIKNKKLIRSGTLMKATANDIKILLEDYHLKTVIDFRTETEVSQCPDPPMQGVTFIRNPILQDKLLGITHESERNGAEPQEKNPMDILLDYQELLGQDVEGTIAKLYESLVSDEYAIGQYKNFFDCLLNHEDGAVLWHCTAGKDRVGTGTALLLSALGVDRNVIIEDYMKTNDYLKAENDTLLKKAEAVGLAAGLMDGIAVLGGVSERYISTVFRSMEKQYGTVDEYLQQVMDLNKDKIAQLKRLYLE